MIRKKLVPKLRFPGFEGAWNLQNLKDIAVKIGSGVTPRGGTKVYTTEGIPFIRSQNVVNGILELSTLTFITKEMHTSMKGSVVYPEDVLLNITGASLGRSCIVPFDIEEANVNQHVCIIRTSMENPQFINLFLSSFKGQKAIIRLQTGSGREGINFKSIGEIKLYFPLLEEQQQIASFLSSVDKRIQQLTKKKELLEEYKKGVMQKIFSQEIRFKDENGNEYPGWEEKSLGDVAIFLKGKNISKKDITPEGAIECIRYGELYTRYSEVISEVLSKTDVLAAELVFSERDDVIIPSSGETALDIATASCVLNKEIALGGDINIIRSAFDGRFLAYYLSSHLKNSIARLAQGISVIHLYNTHLKTLDLFMPLLKEQTQVAQFLSRLDLRLASLESNLVVSSVFKKGLLQEMFV